MSNKSISKLVSIVAVVILSVVTVPAVAAEYTTAYEYFRSHLGLSAEQAQRRLAGESLAAKNRQYAIELLGENYAGAWYDPDLNDLIVATTDESQFSVIEAIGAIPTTHAHSLDDLKESQRKLRAFRDFNNTADMGIVAWFVDVTTNSLVIEHLPGRRHAAEQIVEELAILDVPIRFNLVEEFPVLAYDIRGGDETDNITQAVPCSIGFSISDGFIIAGHCGDTGDLVEGYNGVIQGDYEDSNWPTTDRAWVDVNSSWTPTPKVYTYSGGVTIDITADRSGLAVSPVNSTVCRYGRYTGSQCGTVKALDTDPVLQGVPLQGLTSTTACIYYTDSGGPFVSSSGYHGQGTTSGGSVDLSDCPHPNGSGRYSYFERATSTLGQYGKTLLTVHGENAPSIGGASCGSLGYGAYVCTLSGYDSQGSTAISWSMSNGDSGSGMSASGNCATSQSINVSISATNPYGSGNGGTSFFCHAGPLP